MGKVPIIDILNFRNFDRTHPVFLFWLLGAIFFLVGIFINLGRFVFLLGSFILFFYFLFLTVWLWGKV
jgi:hypothetical protein